MKWQQCVAVVLYTAAWFASGYVTGREAERRRAQVRFDQQQYVAKAYIDSCEALTAAAARVLETNRRHMLLAHDMEFIEGKGWVQR